MNDEQRQVQKLQWEIQQLAMAIDYFERVIDQTLFMKEAEEVAENIHQLTNQIKELEKKRDAITSS